MSSTSEELVAKALREGSAGAAAIPGPSAATLEALAAAMQPQPVSLQMLSSTAQDRSLQIRLQQANFIRRELIARRVRILALLHTMPESLARREAVSQLAGVYWERLKSVMERPDATSEEDERGFLARQMKHNESIKTIGDAEEEQMCIRALDEMQLERGSDWWATHPEERVAVDRHLDAIFLARISLRFLLKHYIASETSRPGFVGIIERACSPVALCRALSASIRTKLQDQYGQVPSVEIVGDERHTFTYVPSHIEYVVGTLLKNSLVATLRRQHGEPQGIANIPPLVRHLQPPLPPVRVIVSAGEDVVQIKLADEAGGISRSSLINVWSYRSLQSRWWKPADGLSLPLARLYCKYFNGSMAMVPMEGYGTDCYVTFNRLAHANSEQIVAVPTKPMDENAPRAQGFFDAQSRRVVVPSGK